MTYDDGDRYATDQLEDLLDAYADARLMPRGPVLARIRTAILAEAAANAAADRQRRDELVTPPSRWTVARLRLPRRAFALGFAAVLTFGTTAAVMAAPPGSAFYNARIYLETVALPTKADARVEAREDHLERRLDEAEAAAARGDATGLAAALAAYQAEVDATLADAGSDAVLLAHLEEMLGKHTAALQALVDQVAEDAAIEHAIDTSSKAIDRIKDREKGGGGGQPSHAPGGQPEAPGGQPAPRSGD